MDDISPKPMTQKNKTDDQSLIADGCTDGSTSALDVKNQDKG